ncbi:lipopolysaccharide biosynthesis protein [Sediminicola luteus]|uniref:Polysaccharide biosynthesis protein n=1 Tax=Sediminicola luteus TaxID=319238 RepID=A0ABV2TXS6_9FLAO
MNRIYQRLRVSSDRTQNIVKHIGWSTLYKGGSILANFLLVPLTIAYLDQENYGVWLTLSSFVGWFSILDIGLGNGLRNKFAEAKAKGDLLLARAYVSCAYYVIGFIGVGVIAIFLLVNVFVDWTIVFNTSAGLKGDLGILMPIVFAFFILQLVTKLITTIYAADQQHSVQGKIEFFIQVLSLLIVWLLSKTTGSSLLLFGSMFSVLPVVILLGLNVFAFNNRYKDFKPTLKLWERKFIKDITGLGFHFFIIQMATTVLLSTDNIIITNLFAPEEVVPYNVSLKYFSIVLMGYAMVTAPYWSSFTEAYVNKDFEWIKHSVRNIQKLWWAVPFILGIMFLVSDWFYVVWVGDKIKVPTTLSLSMGLYVMMATFQSIYYKFINAVGKIKIQLIISIISIVINIPLSLLFAKTFNLGLAGVILATCFSFAISVVIGPIQYQKLITHNAFGIWNK